jgi:membrane protein required for colicin V production
LNYVDLIIVILIAWAAYRGFTRGLVIMVATFIALIIGIWGAAKFSGIVADWLVNTVYVSSPYMQLVSFTITFIGIVIAINIAAFLLSRLLDAVAFGFVNRLLGIVFGILKMALLLSIFFVILNAFNERHDFLPKQQIESSKLYEPVADLAPGIFPFLRFEAIAREIELLFVKEKVDNPDLK